VIHCDFPINAHLDAGVFALNMQETALVIYSQYFKRTLFLDAECWSTKPQREKHSLNQQKLIFLRFRNKCVQTICKMEFKK
jgi:hypothetical protein